MKTLSPRRLATRARVADEICAASRAIIAEHGLDGLTMQRLARAMDRSVGSLYRHFANKDALVVELQVRTVREYGADRQRCLEAAEAAGIGGAPLLMVVAKHFQRWFLARPGHFSLVTMAVANPRPILPDLEATQVMEGLMPVLNEVAALFVRLQQVNALDPGDVTERTMVMWCVVQGIVQSTKVGRLAPTQMNNDNLLRAGITTMLTGWGATDPAAIAAADTWTSTWP